MAGAITPNKDPVDKDKTKIETIEENRQNNLDVLNISKGLDS